MPWLDYVAYFFGGAFLANAIPHLVRGLSGRPFQSPFARPPGIGLSSSLVNVAWALVNLVVAWLLLARVGNFDLRDPVHAIAAGLGFALLGLAIAHRFGRLNGGNNPGSK